ncbi:DUF732 domain-containing protein [Nocardia donostiensis]|uniref:DUF732 domain-containing protein n=1 Tax=Nocardia donostiensis TaxID=1538463 RepID=A0A1W0B233_9NOCA|nr:DUF732 domain-containing protein [Nocardia donostiensis]ONM47291.1 hypothetical protein B0T46_18640 [Nocardia donostiensis]OQS16593.1 hypothetical protein B0T36_02590 [Nocardia donostiensis]OQS21070.1 hypothetical protein B0T44_08570 [Nocardia donostiensis]
MFTRTRLIASALAVGTAVSVMTGATQIATAAPFDSGSASGSAGSGSSSGSAGPQRSAADRQFLRDSYYDEESYSVQDAAIGLAHRQCGYLDTYGNSARNRIYLAESSSDAVDYPYTFLHAAIDAYCPWHQS